MSKLLLVLPVSHVDAREMLNTVKRIKFFNDKLHHPILVVATQLASKMEVLDDILLELSALTTNISTHVLSTEYECGYPKASNHLFISTCEYLESVGNTLPWYFFEADNIPMKENWLDIIAEEYYANGKAFMGPIVSRSERTIRTSKYKDPILNGSSIYPPEILELIPILDGKNIPDAAWDLVISPYTREDLHVTNRIHYYWNCRKMIIKDNTLLGVSGYRDWEKHEFTIDVSNDSCIFHGCKDGSLWRAIKLRQHS